MSPTLLHVRPVREYLSQHFLCSVPEREKTLALTFDDGPNPRNTPILLDLLARKGVRASFFLLGSRVEKYPDLARRIVAEGHEVGSHAHHHVPLPLLPGRWLRREIRRAADEMERTLGVRPVWFRPPHGWFSHRVLRVLQDEGHRPVLGNVHPEDSRQPGVEALFERITRRLEPGSIIILHDGGWRPRIDRSQTVAVSERLIDELGSRGYSFETLSQLVGGAPD